MVESFRPGVIDRLGIGYEAVTATTRRSCTARPPASASPADRAQWAGHDLNYLAVGGYLAGGRTGVRGNPAMPGATLADSAGGGMHAVIAILAALVQGRPARYLDVSVADGVLALMSLAVDEDLATGAENPEPRR